MNVVPMDQPMEGIMYRSLKENAVVHNVLVNTYSEITLTYNKKLTGSTYQFPNTSLSSIVSLQVIVTAVIMVKPTGCRWQI